MTEIYLQFVCAQYRLYGNAPQRWLVEPFQQLADGVDAEESNKPCMTVNVPVVWMRAYSFQTCKTAAPEALPRPCRIAQHGFAVQLGHFRRRRQPQDRGQAPVLRRRRPAERAAADGLQGRPLRTMHD